jgi:hypothetical protein
MAEQQHNSAPLSQRTKTILSILSGIAGVAAVVTFGLLVGIRSASRVRS